MNLRSSVRWICAHVTGAIFSWVFTRFCLFFFYLKFYGCNILPSFHKVDDHWKRVWRTRGPLSTRNDWKPFANTFFVLFVSQKFEWPMNRDMYHVLATSIALTLLYCLTAWTTSDCWGWLIPGASIFGAAFHRAFICTKGMRVVRCAGNVASLLNVKFVLFFCLSFIAIESCIVGALFPPLDIC